MFDLRLNKFKLASYKQELIGMVLIACALFLSASLISFHPHDSSWFYYKSNAGSIKNLCGSLGAQCAALFFYLLGSSSLLCAFLLGWIGYVLVRMNFSFEWDRALAGTIFVFVCATLCSFYRIDFLRAAVPGGFFGSILHKKLLGLCGPFGEFLLLHTLLISLSILLLRFSFIKVVQYAVAMLLTLCQKKYFFALCTFLLRCAYILSVPFLWLGSCAKSIYKGTLVNDEEYTVIDFESALLEAVQPRNHKTLHAASKSETIEQAKKVHAVALDLSADATKQHETQKKETQEKIINPEPQKNVSHQKKYQMPDVSIFIPVDSKHNDTKVTKELDAQARVLEEKLERFGVYGNVTSIKRGPVVTLFEYQPTIDTKLSKILALEDDLALALQALSIRILAPIPGRSVVGFEISNKTRNDVLFSSVVHSSDYTAYKKQLPLILGKDTIGADVIVDLSSMPHLLVAGSTGSGKSVALNAMLISLLCKRTPDELKLILIDPKRLEFSAYADIAHLLFPIITQPKGAAPALRWVVSTMESRYELMAKSNARNIADYNTLALRQGIEPMSYIVVIIDELADLMMVAGKDIEDLIARITQMARASGIHMIVATQRPSVDVITGLIKVNFPSRISFRVTSKIDSRTILDCGGADKLLGRGDMLFLDATTSMLRRVHGAYVSDKEIATVVSHIRAQQEVEYLDLSKQHIKTEMGDLLDTDDQLYRDIINYLQEVDEVSISLLQRKFRIGFNRSARIIEQLELQGRILPSDGSKTRKVIHATSNTVEQK
jgi:S-DNA-T family DNA segregation ATPase FtsK/SpoIIIE